MKEVLIAIPVLLILYVLITYNSFIKRKNKLKQAYSGIDVYLTQRFNLIPNLVECVKGYMSYEKELLDDVTKRRTTYMQNKNMEDAEKLNNQFNHIIATAENYPELKANEQFLNLQRVLTKIESQLQAARRIYNAEVTVYNTKLQTFPNSIIGGAMGLKQEKLFEADNETKNNIKLDI